MRSPNVITSAFAAAFLAVIAVTTSTAHAAPLYTVIDLGDLPGGNDNSLARGINDSGQVVGYSSTHGGDRAFLWEPGIGMTEIGTLPGTLPAGADLSIAWGINDSGQVVGHSDVSNGAHAFLWEAGSGTTDLGTLPGGSSSQALGINDSGQVVGQRRRVERSSCVSLGRG